jgi:hypothetical protein
MAVQTKEVALLEQITFRSNGVDRATVDEYAALMAGGTVFPPVTIATWGKDNRALIGGAHRLAAAVQIHRDEIEATVVKVKSRAEAERLAFTDNHHGLALTADDRRKAILAFLQQPSFAKLSHTKAAALLGVSDMTIKRYRDGLELKSPKAAMSGHKNKPEPKPEATGDYDGSAPDAIAARIVEEVTGGKALTAEARATIRSIIESLEAVLS